MVETVYSYCITEEKTIEKIIHNEHVNINHVVLGAGDALPKHQANSHVYLIVVRGTMTLVLDDQTAHQYPAGSIVSVPYATRMDVSNQGNETLEFFIVKAPGPEYFAK